MGPAATPMPLTAFHTPIALARSDGTEKTSVMIASVAGKIAAAPIPMSARAEINSPALPTEPAEAEVTPNTANPATRIVVRP